jgi:hypothetical protein
VQRRVRDAGLALEGDAPRPGVLDVDPDELDALVGGLLRDLDEVRRLGAARRAPGGPEVQDDDLAL